MTNEEKLIALDKITKALDACEETIGTYSEAIDNLVTELQELEDDLQDILEEG